MNHLGFEFQRTAAKPKRADDDAPSQQPMRAGLKPAQRKAPTADQKKVRRQMSKKASSNDCSHDIKTSTHRTAKENTMSRQREADLLRAMAKATGPEQRRLAAELEHLRSTRTASVTAERELDLSNTVIADTLTPVRVHERHTAATDWITEIPVGGGNLDHEMRTEATLWVKSRHEAVLADREEFTEQARGMARRLAGKYGEQAPEAFEVFLATAARLRRQASDQNGNAESTITDYDTKTDQDPLYAEDWDNEDAEGVHPPMPGAGETVSASRKTASAPDGSTSTCAICGKTIQAMDYAWYHLSADGPVDWATHGPQTYPGSEVIRPSASRRTAAQCGYCAGTGTVSNGAPGMDLGPGFAEFLPCPRCNGTGEGDPSLRPYTRASRTASEEQTCSVCGDKIAKDPNGEDPSTYHHDNGEKHDHEAKPGGSTSEARRKTASDTSHCLECGGGVHWSGSRWLHDDTDKDHSVEVPTQDQRSATKKTAVSLTNVGIEGDYGVGTDPNGNRVKFNLSEKDKADLKAVLYSDLAVNFSGVDVEESDIVKDASRRTAADHSVKPPAGREVPEGYEEAKCQVCGEKIVGNARVWLHATASKTASESVEVSVLPDCDICKYENGRSGVPAAYDGKTVMGPWANMCETHFGSHGVGLGTGRGQRLIVRGSKTAATVPHDDEALRAARTKAKYAGIDYGHGSPQHMAAVAEYERLIAENNAARTASKTASPRGNDFSIEDAKNDEGEWVMSPEQIRAEMNYDPSEYDEDDWYRDASRTANVWSQNARFADAQNGNADSSLEDVTVGDAHDQPMWPWELNAQTQTSGASDVASVATPGGESGYPQPKSASVIPAQGRTSDFRARVQAGLRQAEIKHIQGR